MPDADAEVEGAPGAPLDVRCLDANKDYIIVTWKQPAVDRGDSILGYFVDRSASPSAFYSATAEGISFSNKLSHPNCVSLSLQV